MTTSASTDEHAETGRKRKRASRACDACHKSGTKCEIEQDSNACRRCLSAGTACTFDRPHKKRGPRSVAASAFEESPQSPAVDLLLPPPPHTGPPSDGPAIQIPAAQAWSWPTLATDETVDGLLEVYHRVVYPIFPFFHWPAFKTNVSSNFHKNNRSFCALTLAVCSLAAARIRDQASLSHFDTNLAAVPAEAWYQACLSTIPSGMAVAKDHVDSFNYMRTYALLAILSVQNADLSNFQMHLGRYLTLSAVHSFHQESRWPSHLSELDRDERRRLFWSIYTLDIYASVVFGGIIRHREALSAVAYPSEVLAEDGDRYDGLSPGVSWLRGWNFTTDLYRILEHIVDNSQQTTTVFTGLFPTSYAPDNVLAHIQHMYDSVLPAAFKESHSMTGSLEQDRYTFQTANIIVTIQTLKMALLQQEATVDRKCQVAGELIDGVCRIPTAYLLAISAPLLHHLAGIGNLLGSMVQSNHLSQYSSLQVRNVLSALSNLLAGLESTLAFAAGTSDRLKVHVDRIDRHIAAASAEQENRQIFHSIIPKDDRARHGLGTPSQSARVALPASGQSLNGDGRKSSPSRAGTSALPTEPFLANNLFSDWPFDLGLNGGSAFDFLTYQPDTSTGFPDAGAYL